jgi:hypothetical protein
LQAALLPFLHELKDVAANLQIVVRDLDLRLDAAQLDVVAREFGENRDKRITALVGRLINLRVGGFDLPADLAPEIEQA